MVTASETLIARFEHLQERAQAAHDVNDVIYGQAAAMTVDLFADRGFGEAIAIATTAFQHEMGQATDEHSRTGWQRCVNEVEQLYIDLS